MKRLLTRLVVAGVAWLAYGSTAHADPSWTYTTVATPLAVAPDSPGGGLVLTSQSTPSAVTAGTSGIVATTVLGSTTAVTDHYTNAPYQVAITVKDVGSGNSHTFTFKGEFSGTFGASTGANITDLLQDPVSMVFDANNKVTESFSIGGNLYTVTLDPHVIVGNLGSFPASIGGTVSVTGSDGGGGGGVSTTPEPSTMVLSMLGLSVLGVTAIRRRLRPQAA
jgi:hypothetical protein